MSTAARIIDANANRAREALRVLEDMARFGLNSSSMSEEIKTLRHELRGVLDAGGLDRGQMLASRDTLGDVGTEISTPSEHVRGSPRDIALAAAGRLGEALRSIEEAAKSLPGNGAGISKGIQSLRYRSYVVEQMVALALGTGKARQWRLCVIVSDDVCAHYSWLGVAERAIAGGADCIQLRERKVSDRDLLARLRDLVALARPKNVSVIMNDRPDLAKLGGADGVHVGQTDLPVPEVRQLVGFELLIGVSTSNREEAKLAATQGADYCGVGPMFRSPTKPKDVISGPGYLRRYLEEPELSRMPHLAISGIRPDNLPELISAGCQGIAVSSTVCGASDPEGVCRQLRTMLECGGTGVGRAGGATGQASSENEETRISTNAAKAAPPGVRTQEPVSGTPIFLDDKDTR
ncbi:MAG: thiamine phosphate synthase [Planctomycetota bacterium]|nr:thiamine phosphate synthase [Planctomycetota bacterium]